MGTLQLLLAISTRKGGVATRMGSVLGLGSSGGDNSSISEWINLIQSTHLVLRKTRSSEDPLDDFAPHLSALKPSLWNDECQALPLGSILELRWEGCTSTDSCRAHVVVEKAVTEV